VGLRIVAATVLAHTRLETVMIRLNQCALAVRLKVRQNTTIRRGLSSVSLVEMCRCRLPSVSLTAKPGVQDPLELQNITGPRGRCISGCSASYRAKQIQAVNDCGPNLAEVASKLGDDFFTVVRSALIAGIWVTLFIIHPTAYS
jgi:hypothetical protein